MADLTDYTSVYTFEYILARALSRVSDSLDKRQGSIIYDALAPACQELANAYVEMQGILNQTFALTNQDEYQDLRYAEAGLVRNPATYSVRKGVFVDNDDNPATIAIGSRFSTIAEADPVYYSVIAEHIVDDVAVPGAYQVQCETAGTLGNNYIGNIVPVDYIADLKSSEITDILVPGEDVEGNEDFRVRYFIHLNQQSFGGNIAQYREWAQKVEGVGPVQVYPTWNGGGTVKISILDSTFSTASPELIDNVQIDLDPDNIDGEPVEQGLGLGTAPIGHIVTVVTATELTINVAATITLKSGYSIGAVKPLIVTSLTKYFTEVRKAWGTSDELNNYQIGVYIGKIISAILATEGVENVSSPLLNGSNQDIMLIEDETTQQIPKLGTVTINGI